MEKRGPQHRILRALSLVSFIAAVLLAASLLPGQARAQSKAASYPRKQALVTSGTQWGNIAGFNPYFNAYAVGTVGLCNETLLRYDPLKDRYINWLAMSAEFSGKKVYTVEIRRGIRWSNGQAFSGKDVAYNFKLGRFSTAFWHDLHSTLKSVKVKGRVVTFVFKKTPNYIQWQNLIWNLPMVNPAQARSITSPAALTAYNPPDPIGTGPYRLDPAGYDPTIRVVWKKKAVWWAAEQGIVPLPKPKYVIDLVNTNSNALCVGCGGFRLLQDAFVDLDSGFLNIENALENGRAKAFYPKPPYHVSSSTAWLELNNTHRPLDDSAFRRAIAQAVDVGQIIKNAYGNQALRANPTGLLPAWKKWIDKRLVVAKGWNYSTTGAIAALTSAGYPQRDGFFANKDGSPIDLEIQIPDGGSDRSDLDYSRDASARDSIIRDLATAHIKAHAIVLDYDRWVRARTSGAFDLAIGSSSRLSDNPLSFLDRIFRLPIKSIQSSANIERYRNQEAWKLVQKLDKTPATNEARRRSLVRRLEQIFLADVPMIPLWYDGLWSQSQSKYWNNWPSSSSKRRYTASMARGYMQMTGIDMITHLEPA